MNARVTSRSSRFTRVIGLALLLAVIGLTNVLVYVMQLADSNAYAGFKPIHIDIWYTLTVFCSMPFLWFALPLKVVRPSDFFKALYGLTVVFPYILLHGSAGSLGIFEYLRQLAVIFIPVIAVGMVGALRLRVYSVCLFLPRQVEKLVAFACILISPIVVLTSPSSAGFNVEDIYLRRLDGRDVFLPGSFLSYASAITVNGLAPFAAFLAAYWARRWMMFVALGVAIAFFYAVGLKAPFAFVILAFMAGAGLRRGQHDMIYVALGFVFLMMFVVFLIELWVLDVSVFSAEFFFRRVFAAPAHVIRSYFDLMIDSPSLGWSPLVGIFAPDGVTYLVGSQYYGSDLNNVNTNAFLEALASGGILRFLIALVIVCGVLMVADSIYRRTHNPGAMFVGFLFSILLTEQAATTSFISSGVGFVLLIVLYSKPSQNWSRGQGNDPQTLNNVMAPPILTSRN